jgi:hypothetical protein
MEWDGTVRSRRRIRPYSIWNTTGRIYTIHCMATNTHTPYQTEYLLLFDLDDGTGFTVQTVNKVTDTP